MATRTPRGTVRPGVANEACDDGRRRHPPVCARYVPGGDRCNRESDTELGCCDRQRWCNPLQRSPLQHEWLHALGGKSHRSADRHGDRRTTQPPGSLLLNYYRRGRRREHWTSHERGCGDGDNRHDSSGRPTALTAGVTGSTVTLSSAGASDNVGVTRYNVHRGTTTGFSPSAANRIAQPTGSPMPPGSGPAGTSTRSPPRTPPETSARLQRGDRHRGGRHGSTPRQLPDSVRGSTVNLSWAAATDNVGVVRYNLHRGTTSGFTPATANRSCSRPALLRQPDVRRARTSTSSRPRTPPATSGPPRRAAPPPWPTRPLRRAGHARGNGWRGPGEPDLGGSPRQRRCDAVNVHRSTTPGFTPMSETTSRSRPARVCRHQPRRGHVLLQDHRRGCRRERRPSFERATATVRQPPRRARRCVRLRRRQRHNSGRPVRERQHGHARQHRLGRREAGKFGNALNFNGTNSTVSIPHSASLNLTTAVTMEAWVRPATVNGWDTVM